MFKCARRCLVRNAGRTTYPPEEGISESASWISSSADGEACGLTIPSCSQPVLCSSEVSRKASEGNKEGGPGTYLEWELKVGKRHHACL